VGRGETVDVGTIALGSPGSVHGKVQDENGRPVAWCRIYLLSERLKPNADPPLTDADGLYEAKGLPPGTYTLFALSPRHPLGVRRGIEVPEGARVGVNVDLDAPGPLVLRVVDEGGRPIEGARLVWTFRGLAPPDSSMIGKLEPPAFGSNTSGPDGVIRKPLLPEGDILIRIEADGHAGAQETIALRKGETKTVEIRLQKR
jgi:hypothetical protein